jgi:peroxiredoxin
VHLRSYTAPKNPLQGGFFVPAVLASRFEDFYLSAYLCLSLRTIMQAMRIFQNTMKSAPFFKIGPVRAMLMAMVAALTLTTPGCGSGASADEISISGEIFNLSADSVRLYEVLGVRMNPIAAAKVEAKDGKGTFTLVAKLPRTGFYLIGDEPRRSVNALLTAGESAKMSGDWSNPQTYKLEGSLSNDAYQALQQRVIDHNTKLQGLYQNLQLFAQTDPSQVQRIQADIQSANSVHFAYLDSLTAKGDFMGKVAKMYNFKPYMSDPSHSKYTSELEYFKEDFFGNLDMNDAEIANMPQIYDKARAYAATLAGAGLPVEIAKPALDKVLATAKDGSSGHESILRGYVAGLEQGKSPLFIDFGKLFIEKYPNDPAYAASINQAISQMSATTTGSEAPDFSAPTPDGGSMKLSDLRGKYVMIDFWASWCRPCRAENPNVVKAYNKYHDKGFEILGVSLDQEKAKWEAAIQQDGLIWKHVSDLGGWASAPAQLYGVSSIPATVLLDQEGKIIARNLRGAQLEEKLKEIFGS